VGRKACVDCNLSKGFHNDKLCRADFRKDYQAIGGVIRERFGGLPVTALTATATARVQADVKASLGMADCACFQVRARAWKTVNFVMESFNTSCQA